MSAAPQRRRDSHALDCPFDAAIERLVRFALANGSGPDDRAPRHRCVADPHPDAVFFIVFGIILIIFSILISGCAAPTNPTTIPSTSTVTTAQRQQIAANIADLQSQLTTADSISQVLAITGVLNPAEYAAVQVSYGLATSALKQAAAENAAGESISVINVTLAGVTGYIQQISQTHTQARARQTIEPQMGHR